MHVERVSGLPELHRLEQAWRKLADGNPLRDPDWLFSWWKHFRQGRALYVLVARRADGTIAGIAPWCLETRATHGRVVQFLGSGSSCTDYLGLLVETGAELEVAEKMGDWLLAAANQPGEDRWDLLELVGVSAADASVQQLVARLNRHCGDSETRPGLNCWRLELPGTWDEYLSRLSKSYRKIARRNLDSFHAGHLTLHSADSESQFQRGWSILVDLHQRRRASRLDPGCFTDASAGNFLREAAERFLSTGRLHLAWVEFAGRPAAVDLGLCDRRNLLLYQSGVDVEQLDQSPGNALTSLTVHGAIARGLRSIDFLRGDEPYKSYWRAQPQAMVEHRIVAPRSFAVMRHRIWTVGRTMKNWIRRTKTLASDLVK